MAKDKNKRTLLEKLRYKYRLIVINEDTFEQKTSLRLSRINIYSIVSVTLLLLTILVIGLIAFTPIKYYMPGVGSLDIRSQLVQFELRTDSLENELESRNQWIANFQSIMTGEIDSSFFQSDSVAAVDITDIDLSAISDEEQALRSEIESDAIMNVMVDEDVSEDVVKQYLSTDVKLIAPVDGVLTEGFALIDNHLGIDVAAEENAPIVAVADGTVVSAEWNPDTGHVIAVQHSNNTLSFYKHNSKLLKKVGSFVKQGEAIAVIGNSGELTSGPHLHFELWQNGSAVDPLAYFYIEKLNP